MSYINGRVQILHGVAGGYCSINNAPFSRGWAGGWLDDDRALFIDGDNGWVPSIYLPASGLRRLAVPDPSAPQYRQSANVAFAGGGVWACWQNSGDAHTGLYASTGLRLPEAGLLGVGPDGAIAYKPQYQSMGPSVVREVSGAEWQLTAGHAADLQLLGDRRAIWQERNQVRVAGLPMPTTIGGVWRPQAYEIAGAWWIAYFSSAAGVILHPFDSLDGYILVPPGQDGWHAGRAFGSGVLLAIASSEAEQAGQVRPVFLDTVTDIPTPLAPAPPPAETLPPALHGRYVGFFQFGDPETKRLVAAAPGNCFLAVRNLAGSFDVPVITTDESAAGLLAPNLGHFISGGSIAEVEANAGKAARAGRRPYAYWDARMWGRPRLSQDAPEWPSLPAGAVLCLWAYCYLGESPAALEAALRAILAQVPARQAVALVCQCYTSNLELASDLRPLPAVYARLAEAYPPIPVDPQAPRITALLGFSGAGRDTGLFGATLGSPLAHPEMWAPWAAMASGRPPIFEPYAPVHGDPPLPHTPPPQTPPPTDPDPPAPFIPRASRYGGPMTVFVKSHGKYVGSEPAKPGKPANPIYQDRAKGGGWEQVDLVPVGDKFAANLIAAQVQLSMQPDGSLQSRPLGTNGPYELFNATDQPEPDPVSFLYRIENGLVVGLLLLEAA